MDLIDRDALKIAYLTAHESKMDVYSLICEAPSVTPWISVKEQMPKSGEDVLVYVYLRRYGYNDYCVVGRFDTELYDRQVWRDKRDYEIFDVVAWMPIPKLPVEII